MLEEISLTIADPIPSIQLKLISFTLEVQDLIFYTCVGIVTACVIAGILSSGASLLATAPKIFIAGLVVSAFITLE